jgi:N-acyl-D-aspartate/D-glutamate deacylase
MLIRCIRVFGASSLVLVLLGADPSRGEAAAARAEPPFDLLIRNGRIVDGCGAPWQRGDVAVRDGRIAAIGRLGDVAAKQTLDAADLVIAPGFIDMMGQTASPFLADPRAGDNLLTQGITTINCGEGESAAPLGEEESQRAGWRTMAEYFARLERAGLPINVVQTVGHTQVRRVVLGEIDRRATPEELDRMKALVREAMDAGATGLSSALIYPPAVYAPTEELVALAAVTGEYGGRYYTHMRNEGDRLLEAIDEALAIGAAAKTPVHIFHLKAAGRANWPKMDQALARIRAARTGGQAVAADVYPYLNNGLDLVSFVHPRHAAQGPEVLKTRLADPAVRAEIRRELEQGGTWENWYRHVGSSWDNVVVGSMEQGPYTDQNGKSLAEVARAVGKDPWDVFFELSAQGAFALPRSMSEANLIKVLREEFVAFDTDVGPAGGSRIASHPRAYGSFPRVLARYVRELGVLSLEAAVARMTSVAANELNLPDRGRLAPGLPADLVVFDPDTILDRATLAQPSEQSRGVRHVVINGRLVIEDGRPTTALPGQILRNPGQREKR